MATFPDPNPEALEAQSDFNDGADEFGVDMIRLRAAYQDINGWWVSDESVPTKALFVPTQPNQPYGVWDVGMDNGKNGNPITIYLKASDGMPFETDVMKWLCYIYKVSNVNPVPYGNIVVCWQCEIVRTGKDRVGA